MKRTKKNIKCIKKTWTVLNLFPADFLDCSYYPFAYYALPEDNWMSKKKEIKRDYKLPPKDKIAEDKKINEAVKRAFKISLNIVDDNDYNKLKENKTAHNFLLSEIYTATYNLTPVDKYFNPQKIISKDFAEMLAIKAKAMNIEPYSMYADIKNELPELYNPKRYDFNLFILGVGWEKERQEYEKMDKKTKQEISKFKRVR